MGILQLVADDVSRRHHRSPALASKPAGQDPGTRRCRLVEQAPLPLVSETNASSFRIILLLVSRRMDHGMILAPRPCTVPADLRAMVGFGALLDERRLRIWGSGVRIPSGAPLSAMFRAIRTGIGTGTPRRNGKKYLLFKANTRWKMPGAKDFLTLAFIQELTIKYNQGENVGLVAEDGKGEDLGLFILDPTGGGYEQDTLTSDGPIIYGAGMRAMQIGRTLGRISS
jgi:hypothetical protein